MSLKSSTKVDVNTQELTFAVDAESFAAAIEKAYQRQKKQITVPGFRKGKASRKIVEKYFGEGVFYEEAINSLINDEMPDAIKNAELVLVDTPKIEVISADTENGVEYKAICITKPEITVSEYKGIKAPKNVKDVTDEDIDQQIEQIKQRNARIVSVDNRPAQLQDEVIIDFEGFMDGEAFDGGKADEFPLKLGSGQFIPGFEDQIVGHSIGEEFEINVTFPENYQMEEYAGKPATFKIKLNAINETEYPEFDDELIKDTTEFDTVDEWKADIRKTLEERAETRAASEFENYIMQFLIDNVEAVIPKCMFDHRVDSLIRNFEQSLKQQGMSIDIYLQYTGMDMDSFRETFQERAENEVKLRLALEKIAELESIAPTEEEIDSQLQEVADANNMSLEDVKLRIPMDDFITDLKVSKAIEFVKDNAVIDNTIDPDKKNEESEESEEAAE
ncbi:trigger factor [Porcipelethomonas sp.]|uniref:trigger factor n=1 Tax=Porcipelethomonas sp. TaxID=2981675 RepID=UPI003EFB1FAB